MDYRKYIETRPDVRFGQPCIRDTRISVSDVLSWLANGMTQEEILSDFPELIETDIQACKEYSPSFQ
ncbi:DUF433 domain-containing protein [Desertivirga brevis]|uniref:DUF433 domain-containing protein n=1 Tax=Desertivirga brevis TaxID=2810310 RepID=UPI001A97B049|nr:DUF433 domain-containing protein [Pedobacter sp. SYSU D00873]